MHYKRLKTEYVQLIFNLKLYLYFQIFDQNFLTITKIKYYRKFILQCCSILVTFKMHVHCPVKIL